MRVLVFSTDDHLYPAGGAEQAFGNITERLPHIEFDLICAKLRKGVPAYEKVKNVSIYRMGFGIPRLDGIILALFGHCRARKLMRTNRYDLVWSIMASYGAFSAVRVKKKAGIPFLLTLQEGDSFDYIYERVRWVRKSFDEIFRTADGIQAISKYLLSWGKEMGYRGSHGEVIPNGVDLQAFGRAHTAEELRETRASFGLPDGAFILVTSSRLEKKNGVSDVVEALGKLPVHVCFVICGSGSLESSLRGQVTRLGLTDRVRFMGFVDPSRLPAILKASDAFIRPSLSEGLGNAFLEAMSVRLPTFGTNAGGIPDFLTDGETGFVLEAESPESIAKAVLRLLSLDAESREKILDRAERLVGEQYDWDLIAKNMETLFKKLAP
jgi:glycosyltransferase involved in cell wall biosynthesis